MWFRRRRLCPRLPKSEKFAAFGAGLYRLFPGADEKVNAMRVPLRLAIFRGRMKSAVAAGAMAAFAVLPTPATPASEATQVDLKLVIATDVSRSINAEEARIQREGTAEAFLDPDVIKAIQSGSLGRIAVATFDFSSPQDNRVTMEWHIIDDRASAAALAETIRDTPRTPGRRTSISSALELGSLLIE